MSDIKEISASNEAGQCSWCDGPVGLFKHINEGVCGRCYSLMNEAGVHDAEIFAGKITGEIEGTVT